MHAVPAANMAIEFHDPVYSKLRFVRVALAERALGLPPGLGDPAAAAAAAASAGGVSAGAAAAAGARMDTSYEAAVADAIDRESRAAATRAEALAAFTAMQTSSAESARRAPAPPVTPAPPAAAAGNGGAGGTGGGVFVAGGGVRPRDPGHDDFLFGASAYDTPYGGGGSSGRGGAVGGDGKRPRTGGSPGTMFPSAGAAAAPAPAPAPAVRAPAPAPVPAPAPSTGGGGAGAWTCRSCTYVNEAGVAACKMCERSRGGPAGPSLPTFDAGSDPWTLASDMGGVYGAAPASSTGAGAGLLHGNWYCGQCSYENKAAASRCEICNTPRGGAPGRGTGV